MVPVAGSRSSPPNSAFEVRPFRTDTLFSDMYALVPSAGVGNRMLEMTVEIDGFRLKELNRIAALMRGIPDDALPVALAVIATEVWRMGVPPNRIFSLTNHGKDEVFKKNFDDEKAKLVEAVRAYNAPSDDEKTPRPSAAEVALRLANCFGLQLALGGNPPVIQPGEPGVTQGLGHAQATGWDASAALSTDDPEQVRMLVALPDDFIISREAMESVYADLRTRTDENGSTGIVTIPVSLDDAVGKAGEGKYGIAWCDAAGNVVRLREKPDRREIESITAELVSEGRIPEGTQPRIIMSWMLSEAIRPHLPVRQTADGRPDIALSAAAAEDLEHPKTKEVEITDALIRLIEEQNGDMTKPGVVAADLSTGFAGRRDVGSPEGLTILRNDPDSPFQVPALLDSLFDAGSDGTLALTHMMAWMQAELEVTLDDSFVGTLDKEIEAMNITAPNMSANDLVPVVGAGVAL